MFVFHKTECILSQHVQANRTQSRWGIWSEQCEPTGKWEILRRRVCIPLTAAGERYTDIMGIEGAKQRRSRDFCILEDKSLDSEEFTEVEEKEVQQLSFESINYLKPLFAFSVSKHTVHHPLNNLRCPDLSLHFVWLCVSAAKVPQARFWLEQFVRADQRR